MDSWMILLASPNLRLCILTNLGVSYSIIDVHMLEKNLDIFDNSSLKCDELEYFIKSLPNTLFIILFDEIFKHNFAKRNQKAIPENVIL